MLKKAGYGLFAFFFSIFRLIFSIDQEKVFCIATHDPGHEGNIGIVADRLKKQKPDIRIEMLTNRDSFKNFFRFFIKIPYHMATSKNIFMDNEFMPMAYLPISKKVNVIQLWHGTGTIKKFGLDSETGLVAKIARKCNKKITHLIVNSDRTKKQYKSAFGVSDEKIYEIGLPRTDLLLDEKTIKEKKKNFFREHPDFKKKRIILYAPTFRDKEADKPKLHIDLDRLSKAIGDDAILMLRLHPFVSKRFDKELIKQKNIVNMSEYEGVTTLLAISDCLITDYSSIVFEYCLFKKPMIFYAYDFDEFSSNGRGFYEPYKAYVPGQVVENEKDLLRLLGNLDSLENTEINIEKFIEDNYKFIDKKAVDRLFELIF